MAVKDERDWGEPFIGEAGEGYPGTLTMHMAEIDAGRERTYWLTCSCGAMSPERTIRDWADEPASVTRALVDTWGKAHRCAPR